MRHADTAEEAEESERYEDELHDRFACAALQGIVACTDLDQDPKAVAKLSWSFADAMMAYRNKP